MSEVTRILHAIQQGETTAAERLLPLVYEELRRLAASKMRHEAPGHTLQATALVHEAWIQLVGGNQSEWNGRNHFFKAAAESMRRILIHHARRRNAQKRGGGERPEALEESQIVINVPNEQLEAVHAALETLEHHDPLAADLVKLRYFVGLSLREAADALEISPRSADRLWLYARGRLSQELEKS